MSFVLSSAELSCVFTDKNFKAGQEIGSVSETEPTLGSSNSNFKTKGESDASQLGTAIDTIEHQRDLGARQRAVQAALETKNLRDQVGHLKRYRAQEAEALLKAREGLSEIGRGTASLSDEEVLGVLNRGKRDGYVNVASQTTVEMSEKLESHLDSVQGAAKKKQETLNTVQVDQTRLREWMGGNLPLPQLSQHRVEDRVPPSDTMLKNVEMLLNQVICRFQDVQMHTGFEMVKSAKMNDTDIRNSIISAFKAAAARAEAHQDFFKFLFGKLPGFALAVLGLVISAVVFAVTLASAGLAAPLILPAIGLVGALLTSGVTCVQDTVQLVKASCLALAGKDVQAAQSCTLGHFIADHFGEAAGKKGKEAEKEREELANKIDMGIMIAGTVISVATIGASLAGSLCSALRLGSLEASSLLAVRAIEKGGHIASLAAQPYMIYSSISDAKVQTQSLESDIFLQKHLAFMMEKDYTLHDAIKRFNSIIQRISDLLKNASTMEAFKQRVDRSVCH